MASRLATVFIVLGFYWLSTPHPFALGQDVVENFDNGCINWTKGVFRAKGIKGPLEKKIGEPINFKKTLACAKINAHHNLLEVAKAIRITGISRVGEYASTDDKIMAKLMDMVKKTSISCQEYITDGTVMVEIEMCLYGGFAQLVLPQEIEHVVNIKPLGNHQGDKSQSNGAQPLQLSDKKEIYTGLVVDARGIDADMVMAPKIMDENFQEVYGSAFVSREVAVQEGMCLYENDITSARQHPRVLDNPLTVRGLRTKNSLGSDIIISNTDAMKIRSSSEHLMFLKQCRVIIVVGQE